MVQEQRKDLQLLTWFVGILTAIVVVGVAKSLSELILPVFVSFLIARFLRPYVTMLSKRRFPHGIALLLVTIACGLFFGGIGLLLVYCGSQVADVIPGYAPRIVESLHALQDSVIGLMGRFGASQGAVEPSRFLDAAKVVALATGLASSLASLLSTGFMVFILVLMILASGDSFSNAALAAYGEERHKRIVDVIHATDSKMRQFLVSKSIVNLLSGGMVAAVCLAFGTDLALVFGVLTFFLTFIPAIGGVVALALPIGLAFLQFGGGGLLTGLIISLLVGNVIIERVAEPRIMGKSLDLSPVIVILAFLFFTWLWGAVGAILAVPVTAMVKVLCESIPKLRPIAILLREN
ncbi:MAG: AI-2E family transporter [Candidatus Kapabacteria bacterium]|nr:AI-2E family transporter [Candidatus Kapabacteria bacterium]